MPTPTLATALLRVFIAPIVPRTSSGLQVVALLLPPHQLNPTTPSKALVNHPYISKAISKFHSLITLILVSPPSKRMEQSVGWELTLLESLPGTVFIPFTNIFSLNFCSWASGKYYGLALPGFGDGSSEMERDLRSKSF